jgi:hypothetical protein
VQPRPPRIFSADDILTGRVSLDAYPFRYVYITPSPSSVFANMYRFRSGYNISADQVLSAVELLETRGWEMVTVDPSVHVACMRRVNHHHR